jgi:hypothetical protein
MPPLKNHRRKMGGTIQPEKDHFGRYFGVVHLKDLLKVRIVRPIKGK